ncbi:MAG: 30S ribosomal protein S20 [Alphaproteobacteria bacterium]|nr:30S ribosomal protein S20 [Alphaproteobacteria bacterium]
MANHKSARIRIKRNQKREVFNHTYLSSVRTWVKKVEAAVLNKNKEEAQENFKHAESALGKAAGKGVIKKLAAARKTSRLSAAIKKM